MGFAGYGHKGRTPDGHKGRTLLLDLKDFVDLQR